VSGFKYLALISSMTWFILLDVEGGSGLPLNEAKDANTDEVNDGTM
jgi:hypothetical protein